MEVNYRRASNQNYMVFSDIRLEGQALFAYRMLQKNKIPGLLPLHSEELDARTQLYYQISSRQSLEKVFEMGSWGRKQFLSFIQALRSCGLKLREYLLDEEGLLLSSRFIFTDPEQKNFWFCYYPGLLHEKEYSLQRLLEELLEHLDYQEEDFVRDFYRFQKEQLNKNVILSELEFSEGDEDAEPEARIKPFYESAITESSFRKQFGEDIPKKNGATEADTSIYSEKLKALFQEEEEVKKGFLKRLKEYFKGRHLREAAEDLHDGLFMQKLSMQEQRSPETKKAEKKTVENRRSLSAEDFLKMEEEDLFLEFENSVRTPRNGTVLLKKESAGLHYLIGTVPGKQQILELNGQSQVIGSLASNVQLLLQEDGISRMHAKIKALESESDGYQLEDLNSTNGTFVNGVRLEPYRKEILHSGDLVAFGAVEFVFR